MSKNRVGVIAVVGALSIGTAHAGLIVSGSTDGSTLVNTLLAGTSGIVVSNVSVIGSTATIFQSGTFSGGISAGLGFDSGIVFSSGNVINLPLSGTGSGATTGVGTPGNTSLNTIVSPNLTHDAAGLQFNFVPTGNQVQFSYVFGSTEYSQYVNTSFNDVFAFFVNGVNEALIPGTSTPVSINNVNCGGPSSGTTSIGSPGPNPTNCNQFVSNRTASGNTGLNYGIDLGGFTKTFSFIANVNPNVTNTMSLLIADTSDSILDSAVFIAGGTFSVCGGPGQPPCGGAAPLPEPGTLALLGVCLGGLAATARRRRVSLPADVFDSSKRRRLRLPFSLRRSLMVANYPKRMATGH